MPDLASVLVALWSLFSLSAWSAPDDCNEISSLARPTWETLAPGVTGTTIKFKGPPIRDLSLLRFDAGRFEFRVFDMRDLVARNQARGVFTPPLYSIEELSTAVAPAVAILTAGFTKSLTAPIPAGYLKVQGREKVRVAPNEAILDGVVCLARDGLSILSTIADSRRRAPEVIDGCIEGFQAGPVLLSETRPLVNSHMLETARVIIGVGADKTVLIGYSSSATTAALACALASSQLGLTDAINLQGAGLGGIALGRELLLKRFGNVESTVASAMIVQRRSSGYSNSIRR